MKETGKRKIRTGLVLAGLFVCFTWLVANVDVKPLGINGTNIGFSAFNCAFHKLCGVHMTLYVITDWAGLVPIFIVFSFGVMGLVQLVKRKSLVKVDGDILILGVYYAVVAALYAAFEMMTINYRPILINGFMEASYPSSTTLLTVCVMPTLAEQVRRRCKAAARKAAVIFFTNAFSVFVVIGRLISGAHWLTDILGALLIGAGLFNIYSGSVLMLGKKTELED